MLVQTKGTQDRWKIQQSKGANQVLFIHFENHLFIHGFGHLHALSQIHPPPLDSNPSKSFWVNGGDVAISKCPRIDLDQKKFPKVQGSIIYLQFTILRGFSLTNGLTLAGSHREALFLKSN